MAESNYAIARVLPDRPTAALCTLAVSQEATSMYFLIRGIVRFFKRRKQQPES
jgi:hypothetical protein